MMIRIEKKVRSIGELYVESYLSGEGMKIANDFLLRLSEGFVRHCGSYMKRVEEAPFVYRERQLNSMIAPALSSFTTAFLMESPVNRKWSSLDNKNYQDSHGWVDYWCLFRNVVFLLEVKHSFASSLTCKVNGGIIRRWEEGNEQLDVIEREAKEHAEYFSGAVRVLLEVVPVYETANKSEPKTLGNISNLKKIVSNCREELNPKLNWMCTWKLHDKLTGPYYYTKTTEYYPGVILISRVNEIIK